MKKVLFILTIFFGQNVFAQKANTNITVLDVTSHVKKMFPNHDNKMKGNIIHYRYDAISYPILKVIEESDIILVMQIRYDANGNITQRITSIWTLDSSKKYWQSKVPSKDATRFKELHNEAVDLIREISSPKLQYKKTKLPKPLRPLISLLRLDLFIKKVIN